MDRREPETGAILQITGHPLPSRYDDCRCGSRKFDLYGYIDHGHIRARCTVCGVWYANWIDQEILGKQSDVRANRFQTSPSKRFDVFRRDKFCCVHCGRAAPRAGDAFGAIRRLVIDTVGSERSLAIAQSTHASECLQCGQLLPGIFQSIPYEVYRDLAADVRHQIWDMLERGRLTIDHLIPHVLLQMDDVVIGMKESELGQETLLVTACKECNWGRRETLERWDEILQLLTLRILPGRRDARDVRGYAEQIYFRARLAGQRRQAG